METKKYTSYAQIELDLKILKLEREINYQKIILSVDKTKESIIPVRKINKVLEAVSNFSTGPFGIISKILIPMIIKWYLNKKRGN